MIEGSSTMKTAPPLGPAYGIWMWTQRKWINRLLKTNESQFEIYPLHWICPSEMYRTMTKKNWDTAELLHAEYQNM